MKYIALSLLLIAAPVGSQSTLPPIPVNIVCTPATIGRAELCMVEFWGPLSGVNVATRNRVEAEKLVAILLENSGRNYTYGEIRRRINLRHLTVK